MRTCSDRARWGVVLLAVLGLSGLSGPPAPAAGARAESAPAVTQAVQWPTTEFKVVPRRPNLDSLLLSIDPDIIPQTPMVSFIEWATDAIKEDLVAQKAAADAAWTRLVETLLHDIAVRYQEAGFEPPRLQQVRDASDGWRPKYVVYLTDFAFIPPLQLLGLKSARGVAHVSGLILINQPQFVQSREELSDSSGSAYRAARLYQTLAHELFHAVQYAHFLRLGRVMLPGGPAAKAVVEGTASGAAMYVAAAHFPGYFETRDAGHRDSPQQQASANKEFWSAYPYHLGWLHTPPDPEVGSPYWTASFWFHIAERFGGLSVLRDLLLQPWPNLAGGEELTRWLDDGLKKHERLYSAYAHFLAEFTAYGGDRYQRIAKNTWQDWVVGGCQKAAMTLTPATEVVTHRFQFVSLLGGSCVIVNWKGFQENAALKVEVRHREKDVVDQINLGLAGSTYSGGSCWKFVSGNRRRSCVQERVGALKPSAEGWSRTWQLPERGYGAEGDGIFVVANAAFEPWKTRHADGLEIRFSFQLTEDHTGQEKAPSQGMHMRLPNPAGAHPPAVDKAGAPVGDRPSYWHYRTYGINPDPPARDILGKDLLPIAPIVIPKGTGPGAIDGPRYIVTPHPGKPLPLGYTGPLHGFVLYEDTSASGSIAGAVIGKIGSPMCEDPDKRPIGQVLVFTADLLKVRVQTDLCTLKFGARRPTVVERLDVTVVLPFGWRYREPAPTVEITPGVDYYVLRYFARLEGRLAGEWPFGNPMPDITPGTGSGSAGGGTPGGSTTNPPLVKPCDCSCAGYEAMQKRMDELKRKGDAAARAEASALMPCLKQCLTQWGACRR